jgi:branched-chain amino acid transport system permease protein
LCSTAAVDSRRPGRRGSSERSIVVSDVVQAVVNGLALGAQYALMALGFSLIFGVLGVINFAHGAFYAMGGFVAYYVNQVLGMPYAIALIAAVLAAGALGYVFELAALDRRIDDHLGSIVMTLGLGLVISAVLLVIFGPQAKRFPFPVDGVIRAGGVSVSAGRLFVVGIAAAAILGVYALLYKTRLGVGLRALADDREIARTQGMYPKVLFPVAFALATGLAGLTGALVTPLYSLDPFVGEQVLMISFVAIILGGLGSLPGAILAAVAVGLIQSFVGVYVGGTAAPLLLFTLVLVVLFTRPTGLMGDRSVRS